MRAKDIMTTPVITATPDMSLKDAANILIHHKISAVPVVDEAEDLVGILTEADLVELEMTPDPRSQILPLRTSAKPVPRTVGEAMTREVVALPEEADVGQIARLMLEKRLKLIPIVSGTRVTGVVARRDLLKILARSDLEIQFEVEEVLNDELLMLGRYGVAVSGGVVTLRGSSDRADRRLAELLVRSVPGVLAVDFVEVNP